MNYQILFSMLVIITAFSSYLNYKFFKLPKTIGLTIITLFISLFVMIMLNIFPILFSPINEILSGVNFKETVLNIMLGYLLFAGALHVNVIDLKKNLFPVIYLASIGVLISTILSGFLIWWLSNFIGFKVPFLYCLLFGSLISPTDPIAVLAVFKETKNIPKKIKMRITGEALFNDAAGIILFVLLSTLIISHNDISFKIVSYNIIHEVVGGIVLGWGLSSLVSLILKKVDDKEVTILATLAIASTGYMISQQLHVSAPIAMVISGLVIGSNIRKEKFTRKTIVFLEAFWGLVDDILNSFLFVLIGLEMLTINFYFSIFLVGIIAFFAILVTRFICVSIPTLFVNIKLRKFYWRENILMSWGGMRGGISIALALSITSSASQFIIPLTYAVVILSIVIQGLSFKRVSTKLFPN